MDFKEFAILKNRPTLEQYIKAKTSGSMFNAPSIIHDYEGYLDEDDYHFTDDEINDIARLQTLKDTDKWRELGIELEKLHDKYTGEKYKGFSNIQAALTHLASDRIDKDKKHAEWLQQVVNAAPDFDTDTKLRSYLNHEWLDKYPEDSPQDHAEEDEWWTTGLYGTYITEAIDKIKSLKAGKDDSTPLSSSIIDAVDRSY